MGRAERDWKRKNIVEGRGAGAGGGGGTGAGVGAEAGRLQSPPELAATAQLTIIILFYFTPTVTLTTPININPNQPNQRFSAIKSELPDFLICVPKPAEVCGVFIVRSKQSTMVRASIGLLTNQRDRLSPPGRTEQ